MKKIKTFCLPILLLFSALPLLTGTDFETTDTLHNRGNYEEELGMLHTLFRTDSPDPAVIWRIGRVLFELAELIPRNNKQEKIEAYERGILFLKPYLDISYGTKRDRAKIVHWYTAHYGSKANTIGTLEALSAVPELFRLTDKALAIDPSFSDPYFVKAKIDDKLPVFAGGDKFRMGENLSKALFYNSRDITVHVDGAIAFYNRNWSVKKKREMNAKKGRTDGTPPEKSDREYAVILLEKAVQLYKNKQNPTARDTIKYQEALDLLKKYR